MSEPTIPFPTPLERAQSSGPAVWVVPRPRQRWPLYGLFFVLTMFSTMVVGARLQFYFMNRRPIFWLSDDALPIFPVQWALRHPANLLTGLPFSLTLMFILFAHEMGHYLYARYYRVNVTPPLFVPCPYLSLFGTLGAFIRIRSTIPSRAALFDIGIAGPIAGFIPACGALIYGLWLSRPIVGETAPALQLGFPRIFTLGAHLLHLHGPLSALSLHPIAAAAWVGMFATSLNLLPAGQLDGGHVVFSIFPRWHRALSLVAVIALLPLGFYFWMGWLIWALLLFLTMRHPRVPRHPEVRGKRRILAIFAALMLALTFTPTPLQSSSGPLRSSSGREVWREVAPQVRDALRGESRRLLHRK